MGKTLRLVAMEVGSRRRAFQSFSSLANSLASMKVVDHEKVGIDPDNLFSSVTVKFFVCKEVEQARLRCSLLRPVDYQPCCQINLTFIQC